MKKVTYINAESSGTETGVKVKRRAINWVSERVTFLFLGSQTPTL